MSFYLFTMLANYGYKNGSGEYFITIDTDKCNACGECVKVCSTHVLEMVTDQTDPFRELPVPVVAEQHRKKIKYSCALCKSVNAPKQPPCVIACQEKAIKHSW